MNPPVIEYVHTDRHKEYRWNIPIKASTKYKYNRMDIIAWDRQYVVGRAIKARYPTDGIIS